jgi:hypothetical protein
MLDVHPMKIKSVKISLNVRVCVLVALLAASPATFQVLGGHPMWPPPKHSAEYRKANMLFLRFQDALAAERWQDALSLCSDRVRAKATEWPSPGVFLKETIPIDLLLAKDFGYWSGSANFYGLLVPLTEPESQPLIQWYWAISATNGTWVVDYPPVKLEEYVAKRKAAIQQRDNKAKQIYLSLEPKLKGMKTHLAPVSEQFIIGSPMLFRVDLQNLGQAAVEYLDSGVACSPLTVLDEKGQTLLCTQTPSQIQVRKGQVASGSSAVLADRIDLSRHYAITRPGTYTVQFSGAGLQIGQPVPGWSPGPFGEGEERNLGVFDFLGLTNRIPSDPIKIEVTAGRRQ